MSCSRWSDPLPIARYREAPKEKGLYLIGTSDIDALPVSPGDSSDLFLGANFPQNFFMLYVGQSIDGKSTLRLRIAAHVTGRGNKYIGALARVNYPMCFVTMTGQESAEMENGFLISMDPGPIFNIRDEMKRSLYVCIESLLEACRRKKEITWLVMSLLTMSLIHIELKNVKGAEE